MTNSQQELTYQIILLQTSVMAPIDVMQPNVEDEIQVSRNLNKITRKTKDNIVNENHELKAEEFAWYFCFPMENGFKEERPVKITALDYFQFRILGSDTRFQHNTYLFYALSFFEYYRIKSTISACGKKIVNQQGAVEDVHLYVQNLRESWQSSSSYGSLIENHPEFDTEERKLPKLYELVKKCQIHRRTQTCTKNNTSVRCRFNFPRQECDETRIVSHSSDDFLRNGGRICLFKRRKEDVWENNFHPQLLRLWTGNMDIQPCGSNEAIVYYIAKYLSKAEPKVQVLELRKQYNRFNVKSLIFPQAVQDMYEDSS
ncbi:ATP-dependent DNA helicase [Caerostris extrusa]|uniref:ATP-dependent DNA helicase n=1 Tax=Caerostris extrusa TaxID=172846 RepID=A0AAV4W5K6_CAEEX|nr:ATP-dependent DNA helicase [Caerostris extrusa]